MSRVCEIRKTARFGEGIVEMYMLKHFFKGDSERTLMSEQINRKQPKIR